MITLRDSVDGLVRMECECCSPVRMKSLSQYSAGSISTTPTLKKADIFMRTDVVTMFNVMQYEQLGGIVQDFYVAEDFNQYIKPNFCAQDHNKKWYYTGSEV